MDVKSNAVVVSVLSTLQGLDEMGGVENSSEYIAAMEFIKAEIDKRLRTCRRANQDVLVDHTREEIIEFLLDVLPNGMFGDGMETEYILDGCEILGLNDMTDHELVEQLEQVTGDDEELVMRAKAELGIESMLSNDDEDEEEGV